MVIFAVAALAGFLLFGWIKARPPIRDFFLKPRAQGVLGVLVLGVALVALMFPFVVQIIKLMFPFVDQIFEWMFSDYPIEPIQWPEYWVTLIVQRLTGTEATQFILGVVFGCILRYWGPHFWEMRLRSETRYNWVAISLVGLLLLAAAAPYLERQLGGMTALKTPVAEFQFAGRTIARVNTYIFEKQLANNLEERSEAPYFAETKFYIQPDLDYLPPFSNDGNTDESNKHRITYKKSLKFGENFLDPLNMCARQAYNDYLDIESIRHTLSPVAQKLRLLIQAGLSQNSASPEKLSVENLLTKIEESVNRLKEALVQNKKIAHE